MIGVLGICSTILLSRNRDVMCCAVLWSRPSAPFLSLFSIPRRHGRKYLFNPQYCRFAAHCILDQRHTIGSTHRYLISCHSLLPSTPILDVRVQESRATVRALASNRLPTKIIFFQFLITAPDLNPGPALRFHVPAIPDADKKPLLAIR